MNDLGNLRKDNGSELVLATAQAALNSAAALATTGCFPRHDSNDVKSDGVAAVVYDAVSEHCDDVALLGSRLGNQLRVNALNLEEQLRTVGHVINVPIVGISGGYGFARVLNLNEQGEVNSIVGAFAGDADNPIVFDPESPVVLEVLARDSERSFTDRVRILSQLVCLYCDAIRFGGFLKCPLSDAVGLLRLAISDMRVHETSDTDGYSEDIDSD